MMTLRVDGQGKLEGFRYFWLKYVRGFDASQHCARCLVGSYEKRVHPTMPLGTTLALNAGGAPFVYLCGVGPKYTDNLHLAWRPVAGVRAEARTYRGELVSVEGDPRPRARLPRPALVLHDVPQLPLRRGAPRGRWPAERPALTPPAGRWAHLLFSPPCPMNGTNLPTMLARSTAFLAARWRPEEYHSDRTGAWHHTQVPC
jgi:hypothetical protein